MAVTMIDYLNHLKTATTFQPIAKIELLDRNENIISNGVFTGRILNGSLNVQRQNGVRRTSSLSLLNYDKSLNPSPDIFWINQKYNLYLGYKINGEDFFIKQGLFVNGNPTLRKDEGNNLILDISGQDKWALLNADLGGRLLASTNILVGSDVNTAIQSVLDFPEIDDPKPLIADPTTITTPYDIFAKDKVASHLTFSKGTLEP